MKAKIIDGRKTRDELIPELIQRVKALPFTPTLAIIQVGDRPDTASYIRAKTAFGKKIGVEVKLIKVSDTVPQSELIDIVRECNADKSIHGIIVQLPLPISIDRDAVIDAIDPRKDADGLTALQVKRWSSGREDAVWPATARGVKTLLGKYGVDLFGKKVTVVGRSMLVGKPIAAMCAGENATVTICHSKTADLAKETVSADVLIVAAGRPGLIGKKHIKKGQIVIDVGINTVKGEKLDEEVEGDKQKLVGDVDFAAVSKKASMITPVPGGVGPMTVLSLFENLIDLCENK